MTTSNHKPLFHSAIAFFTGTFISRISGLLRDITMAFYFGAHPATAAFFVSYRLANLFRRLFGEGALLTGFVPFYEEIRKESERSSAIFYRDLLGSVFVFLLCFIGAMEIVLYGAAKFFSISSDTLYIFRLTSIMFPALLFICLYAVSSSLLQCRGRFLLSSVAPVGFNIVWIAAIVSFSKLPIQQAMYSLSIGIVAAFFVQWMVTALYAIWQLRKYLSAKEWLYPRLFTPPIRKMITPMLTAVIGVGAIQINSGLDVIFARIASLQGPAYLAYAIRIQQLPLALFAIAISTALLPLLTRAYQKNDHKQYSELMNIAFSKTQALLIPCTFGIFSLGYVGLNLIYGRGHFTNEAIEQTMQCLWLYGIGLTPLAFVLLLAPAFFAKKDYLTPTKASVLSVGVSTLLNLVFVFTLNMGPKSIALSTSAAGFVNFFFLYHALKKHGVFLDKHFYNGLSQTVLISILSSMITVISGHILFQDPTIPSLFHHSNILLNKTTSMQLVEFLTLAFIFISSGLSLAHLLDVREIKSLIRLKF